MHTTDPITHQPLGCDLQRVIHALLGLPSPGPRPTLVDDVDLSLVLDRSAVRGASRRHDRAMLWRIQELSPVPVQNTRTPSPWPVRVLEESPSLLDDINKLVDTVGTAVTALALVIGGYGRTSSS